VFSILKLSGLASQRSIDLIFGYRVLSGALVSLMLVATPVAHATVSGASSFEIWTGGGGSGADLARFTAKSSIRFDLDDAWRFDGALRLEAASDDIGLGRRDGFAAISRPILLGSDVRLEVDRATISWRRDNTEVILGKQTVPWGSLDGLQVTDRFDPVRRRDFVFTDVRPDRISRWGARLRFRIGSAGVDVAATPDSSVSQQAEPGATFEATAPRFRGGIPTAAGGLPIRKSQRETSLAEATYGLRLSHKIDAWDVTALVMSGPETDPTLSLARGPSGPVVELLHPRRSVFGVTAERPLGSTVIKLEVAHIPDQPANILGSTPLARADLARTLIGAGLDWDAPDGWFANAQIAFDHIEQASGSPTARPKQDLIATLRLQRGFSNDTLLLKTELIGSLSDGDGVARASLEWRASDVISMQVGADAVWGDRNDTFGQFEGGSRLWLKLKASM
jgi:hypothetical protein